MKHLFLVTSLLLLAACGVDDFQEAAVSDLEQTLNANTTWPYEVIGVLDIVEAGGYGDSDYPNWAVGSLITEDTDEYGIPISIGEGIVSRAGVDIDSGLEVQVWLGEREDQEGFGDLYFYPITKIERL